MMKITRELRKAINAAVRENVRGAAPCAEVGLRTPSVDDPTGTPWEPNALLWTDNSDLGDMRRLSVLKAINDDPANPGCHELDLYVTTGIGPYRELETNVCVLIRDGRVIGATSHGYRISALKAKLNFPAGAGF